jgi:hypothetical protein
MRNLKLFLKSAVAFFFLFFLHGTSIENGQQGISYNYQICATFTRLYNKLTNNALPININYATFQ